jgi:hypothetical protein
MVDRSRRPGLAVAAFVVLLWTVLHAAPPPVPAPKSAIWIGRAAQMEAHLRDAEIVSVEDVGTGVTNPKRAHLRPAKPFESLVWKPIPPGRPSGYWESYKSEVAAYELDKLLGMNMVPPAVQRTIDGEDGAAIMWIPGMESVKQKGGKMPSGGVWGRAIRRMLTFDNFIGNPDRNAGNILIGAPGELILIDHSRAFTEDTTLVRKVERVDADLWGRIQALQPADLERAIGPWIGSDAVRAALERRQNMARAVDKLIKKKGKAAVIVQ